MASSASIQVLVVRAADTLWAVPMASIEQVFDLEQHHSRHVGDIDVVNINDETIELIGLAERLDLTPGTPTAGVIVWSGGRRRALSVDELVGQRTDQMTDLPPLARGPYVQGLIEDHAELVPVLDVSNLLGGAMADSAETPPQFSALQQSALAEVSNIGCGHAATALSSMLSKTVEVGVASAQLTGVAKALDKTGSAMSKSVVVTAPIRHNGGAMLLVFDEHSAEELCRLLGTSMTDPLGPTALQEVGNILASSYMNAIVEMTGLEIEPDPPTVGIDQLGRLLQHSEVSHGDPDAPALLMLSELSVEGTSASFSFVYVPQAESVDRLLERLGVGS